MSKIIIATNNQHKTVEIRSILKENNKIKILSLKDFGIKADINEDGKTLEENALIKAAYVYKLLGIPALADDTGLFVDALNGEPGVYSARYAGEDATYEDNCKKLTSHLENIPEDKRTAEFVSVICLYINEKDHYFFKGTCKGKIINEGKGTNGFGYDPIFAPEDSEKTFAELNDSEKNKISHRALALKKFKTFSDSYFQ